MGYRLEISKVIPSDVGGSKLYGYVEDETKLKSYKWLLNHGYIDGDEVWTYGCNPQIVLTKHQFKEYMELYWNDLNTFRNPEWEISEELKKLIEEDCDKLLEWW